jgi:hypothetical protein
MTLTELYEREIKALPPAQRLKLATLILNDITTLTVTQASIDISDEWGGTDFEEFSAATWQLVESDLAAEPHDG